MTHDGNPYRFVDVSDEEQALQDPGWDLRDYVEPPEEPVFGPDEILTLGERFTGFWAKAFVMMSIGFVLGALLYPNVDAHRPTGAPIRTEAETRQIALALLTALAAQLPIGIEACRLARALRIGWSRSLTIGALCFVPVANLLTIVVLGCIAMRTLWRHGIRTDIFGPHRESLPRAAE